MKKIIYTSLILSALVLSSCTVKQIPSEKRTVTVSGTGEVFVENNQAIVNLSVTTRNWDVTKAVSENAEKMTAVQDAVLQLGISKDSISTSRYNINQETSYQNGRTVYGQYRVSNQISISVKDVNLTGKVIDTAIKAGANSLESVSYSPSDTESALKQARILAVKNAESKANTLATSSGCSLGDVISINENGGNAIYSNSDRILMKTAVFEEAAVETPLSSGKSVVSVSITAQYELD